MSGQPKKTQRLHKILTIVQHVVVGVILYMAFSFSLFLGLQVYPTYGTIGLIVTGLMLLAYIFLINKKQNQLPTQDQPDQGNEPSS